MSADLTGSGRLLQYSAHKQPALLRVRLKTIEVVMKKAILIASIALFAVAAQAAEKTQQETAKAQSAPAAEQPEHVRGNEKSPGYEHEKLGEQHFQTRNMQEAIKEFDAAIAKDPKAPTPYVKKAISLYSMGKPLEAVPLLDKAVQLNDRGKNWAWWPLYHKGVAFGVSGNMVEALKNFDESIKLSPGYENHFGRATAWLYMDKLDQSMADARAALKYKPEDQSIPRFISQLETRIAASKFASEMAAKKGAEKTASGLVYFDLKKGSGKSPAATDTVKVHYHGTLPDGKVFDSSVERKEPATFPLNGVIACWTEGLQKMKVGGKAKLVCPASIAYGNQSPSPMIGPGATLVFEVELLAIESAAKTQ
jgi:FKBP-type peptidyl-prolyl cis-trans isomerase